MSGQPQSKIAPRYWRLDRRGTTLIAALSRPASRNALNRQCWEELDAILDETDLDSGLRAFILTGSDGIFSAGGDLKDIEAAGTGVMSDVARLGYLQPILMRMARLAIPAIAAVEGLAVGVAWGLVLSCDMVVAARDAAFLAPFSDRGLVPDGGLLWHMAGRVGRHETCRIVLEDGRLTAEQAAALGLVTHLAEPGRALERALAVAEALAQKSRDATMLTLRLLRKAEHGTLQEFLLDELAYAALNSHGPDLKEARRAFAEKRKPRFGGDAGPTTAT